jgi:hypothetical protein
LASEAVSRQGVAVDAALALLALLEPETQDRVRRRLAIRLMPPASPISQREQELGIVANLLESVTPRPGWSFPYVARKEYDAERGEGWLASASLVSKYGSWVEVCRRAHELETRKAGAIPRLRPSPSRRTSVAGCYTERDAITALQTCAQEIQRAPSKAAYDHWRAAALRRRKGPVRYPSTVTVFRLYKQRGGWLAALEDAGLVRPPTTVRIIAATKQQAAVLGARLRAEGLIVNHTGRATWLEATTPVAQLRRLVADCAEGLCLDAVFLWEPRVRRLERVEFRLLLDVPMRPAESDPTMTQWL